MKSYHDWLGTSPCHQLNLRRMSNVVWAWHGPSSDLWKRHGLTFITHIEQWIETAFVIMKLSFMGIGIDLGGSLPSDWLDGSSSMKLIWNLIQIWKVLSQSWDPTSTVITRSKNVVVVLGSAWWQASIEGSHCVITPIYKQSWASIKIINIFDNVVLALVFFRWVTMSCPS